MEAQSACDHGHRNWLEPCITTGLSRGPGDGRSRATSAWADDHADPSTGRAVESADRAQPTTMCQVGGDRPAVLRRDRPRCGDGPVGGGPAHPRGAPDRAGPAWRDHPRSAGNPGADRETPRTAGSVGAAASPATTPAAAAGARTATPGGTRPPTAGPRARCAGAPASAGAAFATASAGRSRPTLALSQVAGNRPAPPMARRRGDSTGFLSDAPQFGPLWPG